MSRLPTSATSRALELEQPVVVMARGHSGTRVLSAALQTLGYRMGSHPRKPSQDLHHRPLKWTLRRLARTNLHRPADAKPLSGELRLFQSVCRDYRRWTGAEELGDDARWGWKLPETYMLGPFVAHTFPRARYVHMIRDGRDIAFKWHRTDRTDQSLGHELLAHLDALELPHHMQAALSWRFQVERFLSFVESSGIEVHTIGFEQLCTAPVATVEGVCRFLGVTLTDPCRDYLAAQVDPDKVGQYRLEDPTLVAEVEQAIGPTLDKLGYRST